MSSPPIAARTIDVVDETGTGRVAAALAALCAPSDVIALAGDLGAGKTAFARGFLRARGVTGEVPSPTFTLVQLYETRDALIYHFDLYRLTRAEDAFELGIEEAFADGISLIEWPERLGPYLPPTRLDIALGFGADESARTIALTPSAAWATRMADFHV
jgi:tRNA threonylcarbamoyladenosine biosynthesis protein TsaE